MYEVFATPITYLVIGWYKRAEMPANKRLQLSANDAPVEA
jgi:hypothetical protein